MDIFLIMRLSLFVHVFDEVLQGNGVVHALVLGGVKQGHLIPLGLVRQFAQLLGLSVGLELGAVALPELAPFQGIVTEPFA
jgi:hypothetical protein